MYSHAMCTVMTSCVSTCIDMSGANTFHVYCYGIACANTRIWGPGGFKATRVFGGTHTISRKGKLEKKGKSLYITKGYKEPLLLA